MAAPRSTRIALAAALTAALVLASCAKKDEAKKPPAPDSMEGGTGMSSKAIPPGGESPGKPPPK